LGKLPEAHRYLSVCDELGHHQSTLDVRDKRILKEARNELALVRTQVARLVVRVNKPGAEVLVDGTKIGTSPVQGEIGLEPGHHRVKATLGAASAERAYDIAAGELRTVDLGLEESPPLAAPTAPETTPAPKSELAKSPPKHTAPPAAPQPVSSPRTWPAVLIWTAGGVALIGAGFAAVAHFGSKSGVDEVQRRDATVATKGCGPGTPSCHNYLDAAQGAETVNVGGTLGFAASTLAATCLFSVGLIGYVSDPAGTTPATEAPATATKDRPITIEAAPTVGGLVIRGTF
jgi:hypothetical protein